MSAVSFARTACDVEIDRVRADLLTHPGLPSFIAKRGERRQPPGWRLSDGRSEKRPAAHAGNCRHADCVLPSAGQQRAAVNEPASSTCVSRLRGLLPGVVQ